MITIPYEFELYKQFSLKFYTVLMIHADDLQAVSVDEALIDVTLAVDGLRRSRDEKDSTLLCHDPAKELAEQIRKQVKDCTGCESEFHLTMSYLQLKILQSVLVYRTTSRSHD